MFAILSALTLLLGSVVSASAASSAWIEHEGGAVRIVTSGLADETGYLRGGLQIRLKEGWKTYWSNPGESGIPPQIEISSAADIQDIEILFPAPQRITDDYATWAGYKRSVTLPVLLKLAPNGSAGIVEGNLLLGVCKAICIPVQGTFSFDAGADPNNAEHAILVDKAFAALPQDADKDFRIDEVRSADDGILLRALLPSGKQDPNLFLASSTDGPTLSIPKLVERDGTTALFSAEVLNTGQKEISGKTVQYTLVFGDDAVSGTISLP